MPDEKKADETPKEQVTHGPEAGKKGAEKPAGEAASAPEAEKELTLDDLKEVPEAKFSLLVSSIATQVFVSLGLIENPISKKKEKDLKSAQFSIDLLQLLADKTRGNLTQFEDKYLQGVLHELRMRYIEAAK